MKRRRVINNLAAFVAVLGTVTVVAAVTVSRGSSSPVGDHWVDNLGAGTNASDFDGNASAECKTEEFLTGNYDLWHFVVTRPGGEFQGISWNAANSVWSNPAISVTDVTDAYGPNDPTERLSHLWIRTEPAGATLIRGYLDYSGSVGNENLSHSCGHTAPTPGIKLRQETHYDMTWDWTVDKSVEWKVNPAGGYTLGYSVTSSRSGTPRVLPGSLRISGTLTVIPPDLVLSGLDVTFTQGTYTQPCTVDLAALTYDCTPDITKVSIDAATGRPSGTGTLSAVATHAGGSLTDSPTVDLGSADPTTVHAETASLTDDYATAGDPTDDPSTTSGTLGYSVDWTPTGTTCNERRNVATLLIDNPVPGTENPTDTVTVRWCPPRPGLTIGFWGNKTGAPQVVGRYLSLRSSYPHVLALVPTLGTTSAVRNFLQNATCSGNCSTMFAAQFLASAMNSLNSTFADQGVMFNGDCVTVTNLLSAAEAGTPGATKPWFEAYKTVFDDINNARQVTCLTVID